MQMNRSYKGDLWIVIKPAEDVPGVWVSHCLTLDVMSQGSSPGDALKHLMGAVFIAVGDDLLAGRDPAARGKKTPAEDWSEHARILREGQRVSLHDDQSEKRRGALATTAHNGLRSDMPDVYVKGLCRHFDIDYEAFKKLL